MERITFLLRKDLANQLPNEESERQRFLNNAIERELTGINLAASTLGKIGGKATSEKKAESSRENGKKGGRPRKELNMFQCNAMKNGEMHILMLNTLHVRGSGEKARYQLVICSPGGRQSIAEHQPEDGLWPDIQELAEINGFEPIDIRDFNRMLRK